MHHHPPHNEVEGSIFTYLQLRKDYSDDHFSQGHPLLHPGGVRFPESQISVTRTQWEYRAGLHIFQ